MARTSTRLSGSGSRPLRKRNQGRSSRSGEPPRLALALVEAPPPPRGPAAASRGGALGYLGSPKATSVSGSPAPPRPSRPDRSSAARVAERTAEEGQRSAR